MPPKERNFEFLNVEPDAQSQDERRRQVSAIRSSAMRAYRRHQRLEQSRQYTQGGRQESSIPEASASRSQQQETPAYSTGGSIYSTGVTQGTYIASVDPFQSASTQLPDEQHHYLLNHWSSVIATTLLPIDADQSQNPMATPFLRYALQNPTLFWATCAHSSMHLDFLYSNPQFSDLTLRLKGQAIEALNRSIASESGMDDIAIASVLVLTANCFLTGDVEELRVHRSGLEKLIALRGGLDEPGLNGILQTAAEWQV
ncbi:hypothetical protein NA57DRAFT_62390 [Rhizodiscina lignyota]|uniref:Transcription factor domain-containing protein n=1 Tax=Rhizodiscina lignyota TaxID=1504668 RepID=A0A9P4I4E8_9PEZI|nr:hypothetical protein NA57DRAFT_62390 [Rhizodiscina lignyota]